MANSEDGNTKQDKLLPFLLTESSIEAACKKGGVSVATYYRWLGDKDFVAKFREARNSILENTVARLQSLAGEAVETLKRNLNCGNPAAENRSAQLILEQTIKGVETLDIQEKLDTVQKLLEQQEKK